MKILFTGASSFTGYWFIKELHNAGHEIYSTFRRESKNEYRNIRKKRISNLLDLCEPLWNCKFGDSRFLDIIKTGFDVICHHGAEVKDYNSPKFNFNNAVLNNTYNIQHVMQALSKIGTKKVIITGSVFENNEGIGSNELDAFSPYGLSKGLTYQVF